MIVGYCTNIHSGATFEQMLANLRRHAIPVRQQVCPNQPMSIGLWFSRTAVSEALQDGNWQRLKSLLDEHQLIPATFNAFPYHDFHQPVVKHRVYQPDWTSRQRLDYTRDVARLQTKLVPAGSRLTISTLPLGWPDPATSSDEFLSTSARMLTAAAEQLADLASASQTSIRLCLEPEPGCVLQTARQAESFFQRYLLADSGTAELNRQSLGICHDVCHAAVMFESQSAVLTRYQRAGIAIGKVQISSAPEMSLATAEDNAVDHLQSFVEPRYLHQTCISSRQGVRFFEDLPSALQQRQALPVPAVWRTHFHVPVMLESAGQLGTTRAAIDDCLDWFLSQRYESQFEVETYAWEVSPQAIRGGTMVDSIAAELRWVRERYPQLAELNRLR
jgi:sugar phosphate isomerase/epimerase